MIARPVPVGTGVEVDERDFVQRRCTPSGVANWSWSIKAVELGTHQLRLELQPAVTSVIRPAGPRPCSGSGSGDSAASSARRSARPGAAGGLRSADPAQLWFSTTQSMQAVSALTSAGSMAGNMPIRNWLRPSLR